MTSKNTTPRDAIFYKDVSKITLQGLAGIARDFTAFYDELATKLQPALLDMAEGELPEASDQLNTVVETTEKATFHIMDSLEEMQAEQGRIRTLLEKISESSELNSANQELLKEAVSTTDICQNKIMSIFEDLSFQDLTGQRIKRIVSLVQSIEEKVNDILGSLGDRIPGGDTGGAAASEEDKLLKGPQRAGQGMDQSSIDDLLANL